jgi:hypothetical protein
MKPFVAPTPEQLSAYAAEIGYAGFTPAAFLDHYEMVGWVVGKARAPMRSWRAAVRVWQRNDAAWGKASPQANAASAWKKAHAEIARKVWFARPMGRDAIASAIAAARNAYRDIPPHNGVNVVDAAVSLALNNPSPSELQA